MAIYKASRQGVSTLMLISAAPLLATLLPAHADEVRRGYIVQLADPPVAAYQGTISGLRATKAGAGQRLDVAAAAPAQYRSYLNKKQAELRALLPAATVTHQYQVVFNGFAASLTDAEVRTLKASGKAIRISPDQQQTPVTSYTPTFLGLDQPGGMWEQLGGKDRAGEDLIIGIIDSGIWPEDLAYADRVDSKGQPTFDSSGTLAYGPPPARWKGVCQTGLGFTADDCNNKLIGARYFEQGFRVTGFPLHWTEFRSPRDALAFPAGVGGHGTHTSSTAAGNANVPALAANGNPIGVRSGIAPRARVAMYKICWSFRPGSVEVTSACFDSDSIAAIEAAVSDGVDVLNYSISGGASPLEAVEQAFRHAVEAGVFVAAAGGNTSTMGGPTNVAHISPWFTTVAATTHDKQRGSIIKLGNGKQYSGASLSTSAVAATGIILARDAVAQGKDVEQAKLCTGSNNALDLGLFDPAKVAGKIVVCEQVSDFANQTAIVKAAGGVAVISPVWQNVEPDSFSLPLVNLEWEALNAVIEYAATTGASASVSASALLPQHGPEVANFSLRGPNQFDMGVLKPDLAAPGVSILAAKSPSLGNDQRNAIVAGTAPAYSVSAFLSGTSMASPHVAGLAALLKQRHPGWSPAAIKSALMTSARSVLPNGPENGADGTLPWGQGAGLVVPNDASDPGLVYDLGSGDYQRYMCGVSAEAEQCAVGALKGYELNLASISLPGVVGRQTVSRSVTNVGETTSTYHASTTLDGFNVTVSPATLQLAPGETQSFTVSVARTDAANGEWKLGELVWSDGERKVRSPLQVRYNAGVEAPSVMNATTVSGSRQLEVLTGFNGKLSAVRGGLREYTRVAQSVAQVPAGYIFGPDDVTRACAQRIPGVKMTSIGVPRQTVMARFELSNRDTAGGGEDDLTLAVLDQNNRMIGYSANLGSNESITLQTLDMSIVKICVLGNKLKNGASTSYTLSYATATQADSKGNVKFSLPETVKEGGTATVGVSWSGLEQGKHYLGAVQLLDPATGNSSVTELNIDTRDVTPVISTGVSKMAPVVK